MDPQHRDHYHAIPDLSPCRIVVLMFGALERISFEKSEQSFHVARITYCDHVASDRIVAVGNPKCQHFRDSASSIGGGQPRSGAAVGFRKSDFDAKPESRSEFGGQRDFEPDRNPISRWAAPPRRVEDLQSTVWEATEYQRQVLAARAEQSKVPNRADARNGSPG